MVEKILAVLLVVCIDCSIPDQEKERDINDGRVDNI